MNPLTRWLSSQLEPDPTGHVSVQALFLLWQSTSTRLGLHTPGTVQTLGKAVRKLFPSSRCDFHKDAPDAGRFFHGVRFKEPLA